ncbi:MAG: M20/M25/M40 family metallo-hydrolase [Acidobacteria bacterium]|nr:M20/M25/M40 family metallo-hydrolase [Acidobacteriota bacterium]
MKRYFTQFLTLLLLHGLLLSGVANAQQADISARIHEEGTKNSKVLSTVQILTDVYGPRLTGSPQLKASGEWAAKQMVEWGLENPTQDPWNFGFPGWSNDRATGHILSPVKDNLVFEVLAWSPSTNGAVRGKAVSMVLPDRPTQAELDTYLSGIRSRISGNIVFYGKPAEPGVDMDPPAKRASSDMIKQRVNPYPDPNARPQGFPGRPGGMPQVQPKPDALPPGAVAEQVNKFLMDNGAVVRVNDAGFAHSRIRAFSFGRGDYDVNKTVPTVVMRNEDFGRIVRLTQGGHDVELEFDIRNNTHPEGATQYNTTAEIVGTDKKDEVIIIGGHLDSWHSATGATDNATGVAVMMEAARIIKALGLKPRRTIRVALWTGEEQGLLGSQAYVAKHFGSAENPKPAWSKFGGYFNHDTGTGRIRAMTVFGPPETANILRGITGQFSFWGMEGVSATASRNIGGSDHTSFNNAGLPGVGTTLDPIEYGSHTWHTNFDTFERVIEADLQQGAIVIATTVYELAMRDELLPRFAPDKMPKPPAPRN